MQIYKLLKYFTYIVTTMSVFHNALTISSETALAKKPADVSALVASSLKSLEKTQKNIESKNLSELASVSLHTIQGGQLPWLDTGIDVKKGQAITFLLDGVLDLGADIKIQPGVAFWVGFNKQKPMYVSGQNTATIKALESGRLYFARSITEWKNKKGELATPREHYQAVKGGIHVLTMVWKGNPEKGINQVVSSGVEYPLLLVEKQRLKSPSQLPKGWKNMWLFGNAGIFKDNHHHKRRQIDVFSHKDVGILQKDVNAALVPNTTVSWEWIVEQLPSKKAENAVPTHDYLSIAVEFDDGQDLTYMWSSELEVGTVFRCPLPRWASVETHYVIRNKASDLKKWLNEKRNIYDDYKKYIGGPAKRITKVWFIANTVFLQGYGIGSFRNITINNKNANLKVL